MSLLKKIYIFLLKVLVLTKNLDVKCIDNVENLISESISLPIFSKRDSYVIVGSRSHMSKETEEFINQKKQEYGDVKVISVGSSLKLCMVA